MLLRTRSIQKCGQSDVSHMFFTFPRIANHEFSWLGLGNGQRDLIVCVLILFLPLPCFVFVVCFFITFGLAVGPLIHVKNFRENHI